jgi:hypothetical protein
MTKKTEVITTVFDEIETGEIQEIPDIWGDVYLPIQWQNLLGQWEAPLEHWGGSMLEFEYPISQVRHQAAVVPGFLMDSISIAPFAYKVHWGYKDTSGKYVAAQEPDWEITDAWRSRVHVLALLKEADDTTPVIITAGSNTGKHLLANIKQGQRRIVNMLKRIDRSNVPSHLFWMEMVAGQPVTVGEGETQQTICPPVAVAPANMQKMTKQDIANYLTALYVGHDIRDLFSDGLLAEGQDWAIQQPERLQLAEGGDIDNVALPAPKIEAARLEDGSFWFPDLSNNSRDDMIECAMSIPGLFNDRRHAARAFSKVAKGGKRKADQWEAWRTELEKLWASQVAFEEIQELEAQLR